MTLCWAVHRCNGIPVPASASYGVPELSFPLREAKVKALFTNAINLPVALEAASTAGIPRNRIYLLESPSRSPHADQSQGFVTVDQLIEKGASLPSLERLNWTYGQAKRQVGFLCCSSGTSGFTVRFFSRHLLLQRDSAFHDGSSWAYKPTYLYRNWSKSPITTSLPTRYSTARLPPPIGQVTCAYRFGRMGEKWPSVYSPRAISSL